MEGTGNSGGLSFAIVLAIAPCLRSRDLRSEAAGTDRTSAPQHIEVYDILRLTAKIIQNRSGID
jgi:hypothetical protein